MAFKFFSLAAGVALAFALALGFASCDNLDGAGGNQFAGPQADGGAVPLAGGTDQAVSRFEGAWAVQTVGGTIGASGIFPEGFFGESDGGESNAGDTAEGADGISKTLLPPSSLIGTTVGIKYTVTAKHSGQDDIEATVAQSGGSVSYQVDLPFSSDSDVWTLYVYGRQSSSPNTILLGAVDTIAYGESAKDFSVTYISDPAISAATGSISLAIPIDDASGIKSAVVYCGPVGGSMPGGKVVNVSSGKITDTISTLTPGAYNVKIVFYNATNGSGDALYAIKEVANVYANWASSMPYGNAEYISSSGFATISAEMVAAAKSVSDGGIWLGGTGLVSGAAANDSNNGTKFKPVATLRRAFEIANQLAAKDSTKTYTITVQGDVDVGTDDTEDNKKAELNAAAKVFVKGTSASSHLKLNGGSCAYLIDTSAASATFQYLTFFELGGAINVKAGKTTINDCEIKSCESSQAGRGGGVTVQSGAVFDSAGGLLINNCSNTSSSGGGIYCEGTLSLKGATISECFVDYSSSSNGGGLYVSGDGASVTLDSCLLGELTASDEPASDFDHSSNYAKGNGGAIYIESGSVELKDTTVSYNYSKAGGGVYVAGGELCLINSSVVKNTVSTNSYGGGIYFFKGTLSMDKDSEISYNASKGSSTSAHGGGLYITNNASASNITLNGKFFGNSAAANGGAIYSVASGTLTLGSNVKIGASGKGNSASDGGGIYNSGTVLVIDGASIECNEARHYGGGVFNSSGHTVKFTSGNISRNSAQGTNVQGGGIWNSGDFFVSGTATIGGTDSSLGNYVTGSSGFGGGVFNYTTGYLYLGYSDADTPEPWTGCVGWNSSENYAGGVYTAGYFYMLSGSAIENTDKQSNSGIYSVDTKRIRLGGSAYIPPRADGGNCVHVKNSAVGAIEILSDLTADVPVAMIIPKEYNATTQILYAENTGLIEGNRAKFYIKDDDTTDNYYWAINSSGFLEQIPIIGTKPWPDTVGDIVFSDGSALLYNDGITLTDTQKAQAAAIIIDASKRLGVALTYQTKGLCKDALREGENVHESSARSNDDGEPNCNYMKSLGDYDQENYPGYWYADNYSAPGFDSGWYVPARTELQALYDSMSIVNGAIDKIGTSSSVKPVAADFHWSSTATADTAFYVWQKNMSDDSEKKSYKFKSCIVRPVRKF